MAAQICVNQHWLEQWCVAWRHQAIVGTNAYFSLVMFCGIYLRKQFHCESHCPSCNFYDEAENHPFKITSTYPRGGAKELMWL